MDWETVKSTICQGRKFTLLENECRFLSDAIMPSGGMVWVHFQPRTDGCLAAHDGGAAFDELSRTGGSIKSQRGLKKMLMETDFHLSDDGLIWWSNFPASQAADAMSFVSDASVRAAHFLLSTAKFDRREPLDLRVREALKRRYPEGRENQFVDGKHRQHKFDFAIRLGEETFLVQAVTPDPVSVSSAIVKALDVREANSNVVPIFVYDQQDRWASDSFGMLELGGKAASIESLSHVDLLAA